MRVMNFALLITLVSVVGVPGLGLGRDLLIDRATLSAAPGMLHVDFNSLKRLDEASAAPIDNLTAAETYVRQCAEITGVADSDLSFGDLGNRLAAAELAAAQDPSKLVSDDRLAEAFNFLSTEFRVPHPQHLTGGDILLFRTTKSAMNPHAFSPQTVSGSRPIQAVISLQQLVYEGGVLEGVKKFARKNPQPGSFKIDPARSRAVLVPGPIPEMAIGREYQTASTTYFSGLTTQGLRSLVDSIARIMALPAGR